jgi:hypothetical protein
MTDSKQLKLLVVNSLAAPEGAGRATLERAEQARAMRIRLLADGYNILAALPPDADLERQIAQLQPDVINGPCAAASAQYQQVEQQQVENQRNDGDRLPQRARVALNQGGCCARGHRVVRATL